VKPVLLLAKKYFKQFEGVPFEVVISTGESFVVGDGFPKFRIIFKKPIAISKIIESSTLAFGEAYMNGTLEIEGNLFKVLDYLFKFAGMFNSDEVLLKKLLYTSTDAANQKCEVCSHYDLGNDFYNLWLGNTMSYSCAYFEKDFNTIDKAQKDKNRYILKKLNLKPGMTLLDIGCGWGSLIADAAAEYSADCTGITLSEEQYKWCSDLFAKKGLNDKAHVRLMDYRELSKSGLMFDRIVSVGMLEHVGRDNYPLFMDNINTVLKEKGLTLLHYISSLGEYPGNPWMKKYIFPGGVIPSLREIVNMAGDRNFYILDVESLRRHYVKTLLCWYDSFERQVNRIKPMFGEKFVKMWELYLCGCAAGFSNGIVDLHQILFSKGITNDVPITRDYLYQN